MAKRYGRRKRKLKMTKSAIAARRRYRAQKRRGGPSYSVYRKGGRRYRVAPPQGYGRGGKYAGKRLVKRDGRLVLVKARRRA